MCTTMAITSFNADYVLLVCTHYLIKNSSLHIKLIDYFKKSEIDVSTSSSPVYRSTVNIEMLTSEDNSVRRQGLIQHTAG